MEINKLYTDFWQLLAEHLSSDDLYNFSLTCKQAWKACKRITISKKMSYPMLFPHRLTYEQRSLIKQMEMGSQRFKLIWGSVGAGKTIVSISYAIRQYTNPNSKILMCGPPSLIKMWWDTLTKYFGINPCVLHGTNPKYSAGTSWQHKPDEKFILISYKLLTRHRPTWFSSESDLLIFDEAHHYVGVDYTKFKEIIGLTATTTEKSRVMWGIRSILNQFGLELEDCTYSLEKAIISEKLPPVRYYPYDMLLQDRVPFVKNKIQYKHNKTPDLSSVPKICERISHPVLEDLRDSFTAGYIMVNRKKFYLERLLKGNEAMYSDKVKELILENPNLTNYEIESRLMVNHATYDILEKGLKYPKYVKAYQIIKWANDKGEKVLLFDNNTRYLPFLHKFFIGYGLESYVFSTHYDVIGRQRQLSKFKESETPGVLLSSISMLGEGQNVPEANHVIFFTPPSKESAYYQGIGRCWRYPQSKIVNIHLLFGCAFDRKVYEHACGVIDLEGEDWVNLLSH